MDYVPPVEIHAEAKVQQQVYFEMQPDLGQYKGSDYKNAIRVARGITPEKAMEIASQDPEIGYFMYVKGCTMVLEIPPDVAFDPMNDPLGLVTDINFTYDSGKMSKGNCRVFHHGDVVFFKNEGIWLGTAPGLADIYMKR